MKSLKIITAVSLIALSLTGCSSEATDKDESKPSVATSASPSPTTEPGSGASAFGLGYAYENVEFALDFPQAFTPSTTAAGVVAGERAVSIRVVFANIGNETFDPSLFRLTASADGKECTSIFDTKNKMGRAPMTPVLAGSGAEWLQAFSCPASKGANFVVAAAPDLFYQDAMFEGTLP